MATNIGNLALKLSVDGATFSGSLDKASADVKKFADDTKRNLGDIGGGGLGFFANLGLTINGIRMASEALRSTFSVPVELANSINLATLRFEMFLGSAEKAKNLIEGLKGFAVRFGVNLDELQNASKLLIAAGVEVGDLKSGFNAVTGAAGDTAAGVDLVAGALGRVADEGKRIGGLAGTLKVLSDVAAGSGVAIDTLAHEFARMKELGRVTFRDIRRMVGEGIPITESIAKFKFPKLVMESPEGLDKAIKKVQELGHEGKLTFEDLSGGFNVLTGAGGKFFEASDKIANTFGGLWRRIGQEFEQFLEGIGQDMLKGFDLKQVLDGIRGFLAEIRPQFEGVLLPAFQKLGEVARLIWAGLEAGWKAFGLPTVQDAIDWIKDISGNLPNVAEMLFDSLEKFALNASLTISEIKKGFGGFLKDILAPLIDALADVSVSLANIALQSIRLDDALHPGRRWQKGLKEEHDKMIKDLEKASFSSKPIHDFAAQLKKAGEEMSKATGQGTAAWIRGVFGEAWQNFILLTQGFKPGAPTPPGMIGSGQPKPEEKEPARFAGAVDRASKEAYSAILKFKAGQENRAYPEAEKKADAKKLLELVRDVDQGIGKLNKDPDRIVDMNA